MTVDSARRGWRAARAADSCQGGMRGRGETARSRSPRRTRVCAPLPEKGREDRRAHARARARVCTGPGSGGLLERLARLLAGRQGTRLPARARAPGDPARSGAPPIPRAPAARAPVHPLPPGSCPASSLSTHLPCSALHPEAAHLSFVRGGTTGTFRDCPLCARRCAKPGLVQSSQTLRAFRLCTNHHTDHALRAKHGPMILMLFAVTPESSSNYFLRLSKLQPGEAK
ncbi:hypothetical protein ACRRTK_013444 [Alexandromys fortis]